jgi:hypothetical protein
MNVFMQQSILLPTRFEEVYSGWNVGKLTQWKAARILGVCGRTFQFVIFGPSSHYWFTPEAEGKVDKRQLAQFGRCVYSVR